jgi:hypothetical protein
MEKRLGTDSIGESRSHFNVPPYLAHHDPKVPDGFGDVAFLVESRVLSANEEQGNYILTAFLGWSLRSGQYTNGALHAGHYADNWYGKGFGDFDVQGRFGVGLPVVCIFITRSIAAFE